MAEWLSSRACCRGPSVSLVRILGADIALLVTPHWGSVPHATTRRTHSNEYTTMYQGALGRKRKRIKPLKKKVGNNSYTYWICVLIGETDKIQVNRQIQLWWALWGILTRDWDKDQPGGTSIRQSGEERHLWWIKIETDLKGRKNSKQRKQYEQVPLIWKKIGRWKKIAM